MDTSTHLLMSISIAGLAQIDPTINNSETIKHAVMIASIIGSQAPDFDLVFRLKGEAAYIKNHRGITHSLPALLIWPFLIMGLLNLIYHDLPFWHLWRWTFIAVTLHVGIDLFNAYGTQALRPFSQKWIALNIINIIDIFISTVLILSIMLWQITKINPFLIFLFAYLLIIFYIIWRIISQKAAYQLVQKNSNPQDKILILPAFSPFSWYIVKETIDAYHWGVITKKKITYKIMLKKEKHYLYTKAKEDKKVQALLYFSSYVAPFVEKRGKETIVHFIDIRFRYKGHFPFRAIVRFDENGQIIDSWIGWFYKKNRPKILLGE